MKLKRIFSDRDPLFYWLYALGRAGAGNTKQVHNLKLYVIVPEILDPLPANLSGRNLVFLAAAKAASHSAG